MNEQDILNVIRRDEWMMEMLFKAKDLGLSDWMIGAGFVRNKIWDHLHGFSNEKVPTNDIDLIYFEPNNASESRDSLLSQKLKQQTGTNWEVVNQAYTHTWHNREPYKNMEEALADWVETPTCVAVSLTSDGELKLHAPLGIADLVNLVVRKNPACSDVNSYKSRVTGKRWQERWPRLKVVW